tara:strand:+ start:33283 stop:33843 length:561 start_codon:yes stop_codon:yes gene_type:complete
MKHSEVRNHIIETASNLFYTNGYNLTGINQIISEAGIAKATLYNHFKSKEDICVSYLQYKNATFSNLIKDFCHSKEKGGSQILGIFDFLLQFFKEKDFNGCWCINTISELPKENQKIRIEIQNQKQELIDFIKELLNQNLPEKSTESDSLSKQLYLLYEGAVAESHLHQSNWPILSAKSLCEKIIE